MTLTSRILELYERARDPSDLAHDEIAELAILLAESGVQRAITGRAADIASTGGPSSISTLLCPLMLVEEGLTVPKIGVAGRPAGGIDTLASIPGYNWSLNNEEFERVLTKAGYAHTVANRIWAPADGELFVRRQREDAQAKTSLVIASIVAKKLSAGVRYAGLEIRVAQHGNFGSIRDEVVANARRYCSVARAVGLVPITFLTDGSQPYQPYIGRSEALLGLTELLEGTGSEWLAGHGAECAAMVRAITDLAEDCRTKEPESAREAFSRNLAAQGADISALSDKLDHMPKQPRVTLIARKSGFVKYSLSGIRNLLTSLNRAATGAANPYPDDFGIELCAPAGTFVSRGDGVLSLRCGVGGRPLTGWQERLFEVMSEPPPARREMEVIQ